MSEKNSDSRVPIPDGLRHQLEDFRRQLWRRKVMEAIAAGVIGLLLSFLLIFGLDRVWQTPGLVRLAILLGGTSLFAGFAPYWLHRWVWGHRREEQLARLIGKRFPGLGDRLLGIIELQGQHESGDSLSPRLRAAAMEVVAAEAKKRELTTALPVPKHRKWALVALLLLMIAAAAFVLTPKAGLNALQRWLMPFSEVERYTFTQLDEKIDFLAVPFGEAFEITLKLSSETELRPASGEGQYGLQPPVSANLSGDAYQFQFPGQQQEDVVIFKIGDLRHKIRVQPMQRPTVERLSAIVRTPPYLGIPERRVDLQSGEISIVEGSELVFELGMNRELGNGSYGPGKPFVEESIEIEFASVGGDLKISGTTARTDTIEVAAQPFELPFSWQDTMGLTGGGDFRLRVDAVKDAPPVAYLQGIERQKVMLPEETVDFEVLAEDDFGLKKVGITWEALSDGLTDTPQSIGELELGKGGPEKRRMMENAAFSPAAFGLGPQRLLLRAFSEDFHPGRERVHSEPVLIYVLSREEHSQLLKSQFDRTISELDDLARREVNLLDENQRLERLDPEELMTEENQRRIDAQEQAEAENTRRMEELTERMEEVLKGAARNGEIDKETLQKMAEATKTMQELSQTDMPEVRDKLRDAQEKSNTPEKTQEDIAEAVEAQKEVVEKIQKALEQANDANERFEASTFVSRLKKAASEQTSIAAGLIEKFSSIIGVRENEIDPSDQRRLVELTAQQTLTASDIRWIQEDLGHYHARTGGETFKEILDEMQESRIDTGLEDVRAKLALNHSFTATEAATKWAKKLQEWAAKLEGEMDENGAGGGDGSGPSPEDEDFEFMLRVMKMVQQQQDLRARTRVLEQLKRDATAETPPSR